MWSVADNLAQQVLTFFIFAVLARWLTPREFGLLAIAHLMVQFVRFSVLDAIALPVVRAAQADDRMFDWLFTLCTTISALAAALMVLAALPMSRFFGAPELMPVLMGMSVSALLFGMVRAHDARLLRDGNFKLLAIRSLVSVSAGGVAALVLAWNGAGAMALVAQQLVMGVVGLLIALAAEWRIWRPRWHWSTPMVKQHAGEMGRVGVSALVSYANTNGDAALVSVMFGPHATGLYNLAKRVLSAAFNVVASSLARVGTSLFVQKQGDVEAMRHAYTRVLGLMLLLLAPIYAIATLVAEPMVVLVFGERWRESAQLFGWLSAAYVGQAAFTHGQSLSFTTGHSARVFWLSTAQLLVSVSTSSALFRWYPQLGGQAVAIGFSAGSLAGFIAMQIAISRQLSLARSEVVKALVPSLAGTLAVAAALWLLLQSQVQPGRWIGLFVFAGVGVVAYAAIAAMAQWLMNAFGRRFPS